jgi:hypothetical protein
MISKPSLSSDDLLGPPDFSLVLGGPLFQLLHRAGLTGTALEMLGKRILIISLLCWLPLLVLSSLHGLLHDGRESVPFLLDVEVHIKFLVAMPLLIAAELMVHRNMRFLAKEFLDRRIIPENAIKRFKDAIDSAFRLRNSILVEVLLIGLVYAVGILVVWRHYMTLETTTWYALSAAEGSRLTLAGVWYGFVSLPFFQFLLIRWYFRLFVWSRFLWQVSRIELSLVPTHPDRFGGLGFLVKSIYAFIPIVLAQGSLMAGQMANRIFYLGAALPDFKLEALLLVLFLLFVMTSPLLVFMPQLSIAKWTGLREYDALAHFYVREFDTKWLRGGAPVDEVFVGSGDIQSLADLGNSLEVIRSMHFVPVTKETLFHLTAATLAPIVPLALTMMPLEELLKKLFGILF